MRFIESGPFSCRDDLASIKPPSLVAERCSSTVRRQLEARKAARVPSRSGPCRSSQRPATTRVRSCARRQSPEAQQRRRTSFEDVAKRTRGEPSCRRATVSSGSEGRRGKRLEGRDRAFGGRPRICCESSPSPPNAERAPRSYLVWASVSRTSSLFPLRPSTRSRPSRVRRRFPAPRGLFTPALDGVPVSSRAGRCS